jgi:hypothetical protein
MKAVEFLQLEEANQHKIFHEKMNKPLIAKISMDSGTFPNYKIIKIVK